MLSNTVKTGTTGHYLKLLGSGNERGLNFFYHRFYKSLYRWALKATREDCCAATSIVQEAFLRLWLCREQLGSLEELIDFLRQQVKRHLKTYYLKSEHRFQRSLLRVDVFTDADFLLIDRSTDEEEDIAAERDGQDERSKQLAQLKQLLPTLKNEQQLFIRLCLKYSFNYDRIAYYLGGISDYQVGMKVDILLKELRQIFSSTKQLSMLVQQENKLGFEGDLSAQQEEVFKLRYTLRYSFEEIATKLNLNEQDVKRLFVAAHAVVGRNSVQGIRNKAQRITK